MLRHQNLQRLGLASLSLCTSSLFYHTRRKYSIENASISLDRKKHNVFLATNSLIFAPDRITEMHDNSTIVLLPFWLEKVDPFHYNNQWGQTPRGLPIYARELFCILFPEHDLDEQITWQQLLQLREKRIEILKNNTHINVIDLRARDIKDYESDSLIKFSHHENHFSLDDIKSGKPLLEIDKNMIGHIYNFSSLLKKNDLDELKMPIRPHTELYYMPKQSVPKTILVSGTGLSAVWIKRHFPDSRLILINYKNGKEIALTKISGNKEVNYDDITIINQDALFFSDNGKMALFKEKNGKITAVNCHESYFVATGYCANTTITAELPFDIELNLSQHGYILDKNFPWTAPENIPVGSLTNHLLLFYYLSDWHHDNGYELQYYIDQVTPVILEKALYANHINSSDTFFAALAERITRLEHPLSCREELNLYLSLFKAIEKPDKKTLYQFKRTIESLQHDIIKRAYENGFYDFSSHFGTTTPRQYSYTEEVFDRYSTLCSNF